MNGSDHELLLNSVNKSGIVDVKLSITPYVYVASFSPQSQVYVD